MIGRNHFVRQATSLLKFAKSTKTKATDVKSKMDGTTPPPDKSPQASDVEADLTEEERSTVPRLTAEESKVSSAVPVKEKKTAEELAAMILKDLSLFEGCPKRGVKVTVYGLNPWNSMLTFGADAGSVPNKADLQRLYETLTEQLKRRYDIGD